MRRLMLRVGVVAAVVAMVLVAGASSAPRSAGSVGGGAADAMFWTRGVIKALAVDGPRVAAVTGNLSGSCARIVVWTAPGKKFATFATHSVDCPPRAYTSYVAGVAIGAGRVAWIEEGEGNNQELYLYAAKVSGGTSRELDHAYNGMGAAGDPEGDYLGQLFGAGALLAFNKWHECSDWAPSGGELPTADCPRLEQVSGETLKWLSSTGRVRVKSGSRSLHLQVVGGGRMAVDSLWDDSAFRADSRAVDVLSASGALIATVPATSGDPPRALALSATRLVIERRRSLDVHNPATGDLVRTIRLGSAAPLILVGVNSKLALLSGFDRDVLVRLSDGKQVKLSLQGYRASPVTPISPGLSEAGLFYAYNVTTTPAKGRIVYTPTQELLARFR